VGARLEPPAPSPTFRPAFVSASASAFTSALESALVELSASVFVFVDGAPSTLTLEDEDEEDDEDDEEKEGSLTPSDIRALSAPLSAASLAFLPAPRLLADGVFVEKVRGYASTPGIFCT
jgi:hypothetical protein